MIEFSKTTWYFQIRIWTWWAFKVWFHNAILVRLYRLKNPIYFGKEKIFFKPRWYHFVKPTFSTIEERDKKIDELLGRGIGMNITDKDTGKNYSEVEFEKKFGYKFNPNV